MSGNYQAIETVLQIGNGMGMGTIEAEGREGWSELLRGGLFALHFLTFKLFGHGHAVEGG